MTRLFFNEYFERKEERLAERQDENLFTLEKTDVNNFEFISVSEHLEIIKKRDELLDNSEALLRSFKNLVNNEPKIKLNSETFGIIKKIEQWLKQYEELKR